MKSNVIACMQFLEAIHVVEILREAGPDGASVKDIARKATEIRRSKDPKAAEIDSSKLSTYSSVLVDRKTPLTSSHPRQVTSCDFSRLCTGLGSFYQMSSRTTACRPSSIRANLRSS